MKFGILTYHAHYNFGANLQAFATVAYLRSLGHEPVVLNFRSVDATEAYRKMVPREQWAGHERFCESRLPLTRCINTKCDLAAAVREEQLSGIIVGADAVWSYPRWCTEPPVFFLDWLFADAGIARIPAAAMAVANMSGGFSHLGKDQLSAVRSLIRRFAFISVRDDWTKRVVNCHIYNGEQVVACIVPDPAVCLERYITEPLERRNLVSEQDRYFILTLPIRASHAQETWLAQFKRFANRKGYKVGELPLPEGPSGLKFDFSVPYPIDPLQWYLWIKHSSGFLGLRFHPIVSCISAGVPFISVDCYGKSSTMINLVNRTGLHKLGGRFDQQSKIYQLLAETPFCDNRVHSIAGLLGLPPKAALNRLEICSRKDLLQVKNDYVGKYLLGMEELMRCFVGDKST